MWPTMNPKRTLVLAFLTILTPALMGCQLGYIVRQGVHQFRLLAQTRPVEEVLADPTVPSHIKDKIRLVQEVRAFGESHLGLSPSGAYRSYIEIQGDVVAYVVSASAKDRLEPYLWRFPLVGRFPYKGFFRLQEARAQRQDLDGKGYDTHLSGVAAFSALRWFSDPLYSSMLRMDEIDLVYTILHEMVHSTVFFPNHVDFNEQLATFVGWRGTVAFMETVHGSSSPMAHHAEDAIHDERLMGAFLTWAHGRLDAFYALPLSPEEKLARRQAVFEEIRAKLVQRLEALKTKRFSALEHLAWNNASLLALWRYRYDTGPLEALYAKVGNDLQTLMSTMRHWRELGLDPRTALERKLSGEDSIGTGPYPQQEQPSTSTKSEYRNRLG